MFHKKKQPTAQDLANDIAHSVGRRGWPAGAGTMTESTPFGDIDRWSVIIPGRGVAVINNELRIVVASSERLTAQSPSFDHTDADSDAEQILRNLPLP